MHSNAVKCCIKSWVHLYLRPNNMLFGRLQPLRIVEKTDMVWEAAGFDSDYLCGPKQSLMS